MSQLEQLPAGAVVRARPWDVGGAGLAAPMVLWGFLGWFGTVGDSSGGASGFFSGTGAAGIGLVFAAAAITINQVLAGRAHDRTSPPLPALLAAAAVIIIVGGMIAKPDSSTIQAGSVAGLLTAMTQAGVLVVGWLKGSQKAVKAANVRAVDAQQTAADLATAAHYGSPYLGYGNGYGQPYPPRPSYAPATGAPYPPAQSQPYPQAQNPYPAGPSQPYPPGQNQPYPGQYPYPQARSAQNYPPPN